MRKLELAGAQGTLMAAEENDAELSAALATAGWTAVAVLTTTPCWRCGSRCCAPTRGPTSSCG